MKLRKNKALHLIIAAFIVIAALQDCKSQSSASFTALQDKYPNNTVIIASRSVDVSITLNNGKPEINMNNYDELLVLENKATFLTDSKEYFNSRYDLKKIEAYSLVPDESQYKKIAVQKFTRTAEIGDGLFFDDGYAYSFTFPSVGKGTRLITNTELLIRDPFTPFSFNFGNGVPAEQMKISVTCPENIELIYHLFGKDTSRISFNSIRKGGKITYQWKSSDSKSYDESPDAPSTRYYVPHLIVQIAGYSLNGKRASILGSIDDLYNWYYSKICNINPDSSPIIKQLTDSITRNKISDREKVRSLFTWVQRNIKYIAIEDGENGYIPRSAELVLKKRYGDCKDKSSLLVTMLRSQGLKASFAWVGTRDLPYRYSDFASVYNDNHMIAVWWEKPDNPVLLDGTTYNHRMEDIPAFIQGKECLIEKGENKYSLYTIPVAAPVNNTTYDSVFIKLQGDTVIGKGRIVFTGEQKARMASVFEGCDPDKIPILVSQQIPKVSNKFIITTACISDLSDVDHPFTIDYEFYLPDYYTRSNENTYLNLNLDRFLQAENIREDRWIPYESESTMVHKFICIFQIPAGYSTGILPENSSFDHSQFGFLQEYKQVDQQITLASNVFINFQIIEGDEMNQFRNMLSSLSRNYLRSITLKKNTTL